MKYNVYRRSGGKVGIFVRSWTANAAVRKAARLLGLTEAAFNRLYEVHLGR